MLELLIAAILFVIYILVVAMYVSDRVNQRDALRGRE